MKHPTGRAHNRKIRAWRTLHLVEMDWEKRTLCGLRTDNSESFSYAIRFTADLRYFKNPVIGLNACKRCAASKSRVEEGRKP